MERGKGKGEGEGEGKGKVSEVNEFGGDIQVNLGER